MINKMSEYPGVVRLGTAIAVTLCLGGCTDGSSPFAGWHDRQPLSPAAPVIAMAEPASAAIPTIRAIPKSKPAGLAAAAARGSTPAAPRTARSPGSLSWPVHGQIRRAYGEQASGARNDGLDIVAPEGSPVVAVEGGIVTYAGSDLPGYGNMLLIRHSDGCTSVYAHNEALLVAVGAKVARGQAIARVGRTGGVQEAQLHFQLRIGNRPVDPQPLLEPAVTVVASLTPSTLAALGAR